MNPDSLKCGVVLLAAGQGSRMGGVPKCLLTVDGVTLLERHLAAMADAGIDRVVVVSGHYHASVEPVAARFPVTLVRNPDPDAGQPSSVKLGVGALGGDFDVIIVALADQPLVGRAELQELLAAFASRPDGTDVVYPEVDGERGNPVAFSGELIRTMLASGRLALRKFTDENPQRVHRHRTANAHFVIDLDTVDDVEALGRRTGWRLSLPADPGTTGLDVSPR